MRVAVLMGSPRDRDKMAPVAEMLGRLGIEADQHVLSAHRTPDQVAAFARTARQQGFAVLICGAGLAAHLAGAVAAHTTLPVIGVPLSGGPLGGVDALYATVQMPRGVPVATVAVDGAANAAILAAEMLAITDSQVAERLDQLRSEWAGAAPVAPAEQGQPEASSVAPAEQCQPEASSVAPAEQCQPEASSVAPAEQGQPEASSVAPAEQCQPEASSVAPAEQGH